MVLSALFMAGILAGCGQENAGHNRVSLLPDTTAKGEAWEWTSSCQFAPHGSAACETSGPDLGSAQLDGDEWNLGGGAATAGSVNMSVDSRGALVVKGAFPSTPPCTSSTCIASSANTWVRGYPSVSYGINQCGASTSPPESPKLALPMQVRTLPSDLIGTTTYDSETSQVTYDIAYDMWLDNSDTKTPCRNNGTLEVMVWTAYDAKALLPDGMHVGDATIPFAVDGHADPGKEAWSMYASNVYQGGQTAPWGGTVWVVLNQAAVIDQGTVSVDLSAALAAVGSLLQQNYGWRNFNDTYWLDTIPFGIEFGPESADAYGAGSTNFSMNLSAFCLDPGTTVSKVSC